MKLTRDVWLAIGLLVTLIVIMSFVALGQQQQGQQLPPLTSLSGAPDGALALKLWLQKLDYTVIEETSSSYHLPKAARIVFVLQPSLIEADDLKALDTWVLNGGTLIAAGDFGFSDLTEHFDFKLDYFDPVPKAFTSQTPLLLNPALQTSIPAAASDMQSVFYLIPPAPSSGSRSSYVTYLAADGKPVLVSFDMGKGRVILSSSTYPFSNLGLKQAGNPALLLNLLGLARKQGPVWFDEWHHGFRGAADTATGPDNWLRYTPLGRSVFFVAIVIFLALLLRGRIFGRAVPLPRELRRRGALEHVTAMANLSRLAGHRHSVLLQYHHQLKRTLGRRYRLDPALPDADYVATLSRYNPAIDGQALLVLLNRLQQKKISETELVHLAAEAAKWIKDQ
jgi:hypothetical protein